MALRKFLILSLSKDAQRRSETPAGYRLPYNL